MNTDDFVGGHSILALERFMDETRHMIIFDVLSWKSPVGEKGERLRLFLSDVGYAKAQASEKRGEIKIRKHAAVIEGHILPDRKKRHHYPNRRPRVSISMDRHGRRFFAVVSRLLNVASRQVD